MRERAIIGTAIQVRDCLAALASALQVQEVAVLTPCHDAAARRRSYALLAGAFGLAQDLAAAA